VPCREGTVWQHVILERLAAGTGRPDDLTRLRQVSEQIAGKTLCALGDFAAAPPQGALRKFPEHFAAHLAGACPLDAAAAIS